MKERGQNLAVFLRSFQSQSLAKAPEADVGADWSMRETPESLVARNVSQNLYKELMMFICLI